MKKACRMSSRTGLWTVFPVMLALALFLFLPVVFERLAGEVMAQEVKVSFKADTFPAGAAADAVPGWTTWSQREETRPHFFGAPARRIEFFTFPFH